MIALAALLLLGALGAGEPQTDHPADGKTPVVIINPSWLEAPQPSNHDYPPFAWMIGVGARFDVERISNAQGLIKNAG